ncbi:hypothetical protein OJAV_G00077760 [Oryzias javanicus]|uniref:Immunoglobulin V-set domain-containing protein n=1 Tax=Oryzias javanicus TaxID=123683 RepID=A0A437D339_ORYJA|nr:hypothetical protein OJAV_G00077760 [Oryzias javanicus]
MRTLLLYFLFIQLFEARSELQLKHLMEGESVGLSCIPQKDRGSLVGLQLYHHGVQSQTTLLSVTESGRVKVDPELRPRLKLHGTLNSLQINVSISLLQPSDTGVYVWELSYGSNSSDWRDHSVRTMLLVEGAGKLCQSYHTLLLTMAAAAGFLLLTLAWIAAEIWVKKYRHSHPKPHSSIYEEMSAKQQSSGTPQNNQEAHPQLEEASTPVYANTNIRQLQDNYYACPRLPALRC